MAKIKLSTLSTLEDKVTEIKEFIKLNSEFNGVNIICNSKDNLVSYFEDYDNIEFTYVDINFKRHRRMSSCKYKEHLEYCTENNQINIVFDELRNLSLSDNGYKNEKNYGGRWSNYLQLTLGLEVTSLHFLDKGYLRELSNNPSNNLFSLREVLIGRDSLKYVNNIVDFILESNETSFYLTNEGIKDTERRDDVHS